MNQQFRARLKKGEQVFGTIVSLASSAVTEILSRRGFDWLFVDGEHGAFTLSDLQGILQAASPDVACIYRVPTLDEGRIKQVLDLGVSGIIVPQVNTAEQAERVVRYARYAPEGARGVGVGRAHGYGMSFQDYVSKANEHVTVIVQAEDIDAVNNIESIVKVPGVDAVLLGPYDLSASMGKLGQLTDPEVIAAIEKVRTTCVNAKMPVGIFTLTPSAMRPYVEQGYSLIVVGVDTMLLGTAATKLVEELHQMRS